MKTLFWISIIFLIFIPFQCLPQQPESPYDQDIRKFKESDQINPPPADAILFVGSSSFRMWMDVQEDFPGYSIINRGFGGSTILDLIRYAEDVVFPYLPRQIVVYCGENDIAYSDTVTGEVVAERFRRFFFMVRSQLPEIQIAYVSMKPSPSRWHLRDRFMEGNKLIREFLEDQVNTGFVNVWDNMLDREGKPEASLFLDDELHMNENGYTIWKKAILPKLIKE